MSVPIAKSLLWIALIDFVLLNVSFFVCNYFKRGTFHLLPGYTTLLFLFYLCWAFASYVGDKFKLNSYHSYRKAFLTILRASLYITYCIAFLVVIFGLELYSRVQIFSTGLVLFILEAATLLFHYWIMKNAQRNEPQRIETRKINKEEYGSKFLVGIDLLLILIAFFAANYFKRGEFILLPHYDKLLLIVIGIWFLSSMVTKKFYIKEFKNFSFYFWQWVKASIIMLATVSVVVFGFRLFYYSRFQIFGSILFLTIMEIIVLFCYWRNQKSKKEIQDIESVEIVKNILNQETLPLNIDIELIRKKLLEPSRIKIKKKLSGEYSELFEFIDQNINLNEILNIEIIIKNGCDPFIVGLDELPSVRVLLNMHKVNDVRRINQYFLQVHQTLVAGGYFISWAHTIRTHEKWIYSKFPRKIANVVYFSDFCFKRILPKLPGLKKIYFALTKGNGRIISRAEVLGRLCFCGFEIVAEEEINKRLCFIARKAKTPSLDQSPTYGPLIKLNRVGFDNKIIYIYKFRTMHPYSEYLQKYVYDMKGLEKGGKINDDFRMTTWGKVMRKCWIDELPMLYNWIKGDLQFIGVRPLSLHYFSLYDEELQGLRQRVKPGLIPPFYADLPTTFEEICDSEKKYIRAFLKYPIATQWRYFWKIVVNIVFMGVRSN
jgi:hypothetical protein